MYEKELKEKYITINKCISHFKNDLQLIYDTIQDIEKLKLMKNKQLYINTINSINVLVNDLNTVNYHEFKDNKLNWK